MIQAKTFLFIHFFLQKKTQATRYIASHFFLRKAIRPRPARWVGMARSYFRWRHVVRLVRGCERCESSKPTRKEHTWVEVLGFNIGFMDVFFASMYSKNGNLIFFVENPAGTRFGVLNSSWCLEAPINISVGKLAFPTGDKGCKK